MKEYLIFHYVIDGQSYVEAYPCTFGQATLTSCRCFDALLENNVAQYEWAYVSAPSRNSARRAAYTNWVCSDGVGFAELPYRVYAP